MAYYGVFFRRMISSFILMAGISTSTVFAQNSSQANRLYQKALSLQEVVQYDSSSVLLRQAISHYKTAGKWAQVSKCFNALSFNARFQHKLDEAEKYARRVLAINQKYASVPPSEMVSAYHNLGIIRTEQSRYDDALRWLEKGLALKKQIPPQVEAALFAGIGSVYHEQGKYERAMEQFRTGVEMLDTSNPNHQKRLAVLYNYIGVNYVSMGRYDLASAFYRKELEMNQMLYGEGHPHVAGAYNNLGGLSYRAGDVGRAISYFTKAAKSLTQLHGENHPEVALVYNNIGASYFHLGEPQKAIEYLKKSAEIKENVRGPNHPDLAVAYNNIGSIFLELGKYKKAGNYLRSSLSIRKKALGANHPDLTNTYNSLGLLYLKQSKPDSAIFYFEREVEITRKYRGEKHPYVADALNNIAKAYAGQGFFERALGFHQQALEVLSNGFKAVSYANNPAINSIRYPNFAAKVLFDKGKTLYQFYDKSKNTSLLKAGLLTYHYLSELLDFMQTGFQNKQSKLLMSRESHEIYERAIQTAYRLFEATGEQKYLKQAFFFAEKSKTRVILGLIKNQQAKHFAGIPDSLIRYEKQLREQITEVHQQLNYAIEMPGDTGRTDLLRDSLFTLKQSLNRHINLLDEEFPRYHNLKYNHEIPKVDDVQQTLEQQNMTLVEYFYGKKSAWAFVIDGNDLHLTPLPFDSSLSQNITRFRKSIVQQNDSLYLQLASQLYEQLLQPVAKQIEGQNILLVPDGALNLLPFEALLVRLVHQVKNNFSFTGLPYLINDFSISYTPSFSLSALSETPAGHTYSSNFAAFAPVTFSNEVAAAQEISRSGEDWPPLFFSEYEVREIAALFDDEGFWNFWEDEAARLFMNETATEAAFKTADLSNYRFLHLATHAFAADTGAFGSGIVFYPGANPSEDGILYAEEVYNLELQNELAVLSACETGTGQVMKGEGIIGLSRAFRYAGVENLLVSLWKVEDRSTARLMIDFYTQHLNGASYADALRSAKKKLIARPAYAHPKFWAPFVFIGR